MRWFKHLSNASEDEKLAELIEIHGAEGYGIYWMILEKIADKMSKGQTSTNCKYPASKWAKICGKNPRGMNKFYETFAYLKLMKISYINNESKHINIDCHNLLKYRDEYTKKSRQQPDNKPSESGETPDQERDTESDTESESKEESIDFQPINQIDKEVDYIINLSNELFTRNGYEINPQDFNARNMIGLCIGENGVKKIESAINEAKKSYYDNPNMYQNCKWGVLFRQKNIDTLYENSQLEPPTNIGKTDINQMPEELK